MSRANAQVRFPDGTIKYGIYNGTVDVYWEPLFDSAEEAWEAWREYYNSEPLNVNKWLNIYDDGYYDVEIADDYGRGDCYIGRASKSQIVSAVNVEYMNRKGKGGLPDWWDMNEEDDTTGVDYLKDIA